MEMLCPTVVADVTDRSLYFRVAGGECASRLAARVIAQVCTNILECILEVIV